MLNAKRIQKIGIGDELNGQDESFKTWSLSVYKVNRIFLSIKIERNFELIIFTLKSSLEAFGIETDFFFNDSLSLNDQIWSPQTVRLTVADKERTAFNLCQHLSDFHGRKIVPSRLEGKQNLQSHKSG